MTPVKQPRTARNPNWREEFWPYSVTAAVMDEVASPNGTIFLHDLPAVRGEDVQEEILDGPQSLAWRQAQYKTFSAMAILEWCLNGVERNAHIRRSRAQLSAARPA